MRFSLITLAACVFASGQVLASPIVAREDDNYFCVYFYKKPNFEEEAGFSCRGLDAGESSGSPRGNMPVVASLTAPDWIQVTLFDNYYYNGASKVFQGNTSSIDPTVSVHSIKFANKK